MEKIYDVIIIGAGPAGLSAAIYLGRAHRKTLLIHKGNGRTSYALNINNYLGFDHITGRELLDIGLKQAKKYNVEVLLSTVENVKKNEFFKISTNSGDFLSKFLVVASGVDDIIPKIDNAFEYLGKTLYICPDCDGNRMTNKNCVIIGNNDKAAKSAIEIKQLYSDKITIITGEENEISEELLKKLKEKGIKVINKAIKRFNGENGIMESLEFEDGENFNCDCALSTLGVKKNNEFLKELDLKQSEKGIEVDNKYKSSINELYAVGPINIGPDQVSVAVGQGAIAGMAIVSALRKQMK